MNGSTLTEVQGEVGQLQQVARFAYDNVFPHFHLKDRADVFLIGKATQEKNSFRAKLQQSLPSPRGIPIRIHYPEILFNELINTAETNLLDLENILAESVHGVVICLESPGAIAELGAFANHHLLRKRLIVIMDREYKDDRSFIRLGPVRLLERERKDSVIFWDMDDMSKPSMDLIARRLRSKIRQRVDEVEVSHELRNPLVAESFFLLLLYLIGPAKVSQLLNIVEALGFKRSKRTELIFSAALQSLFGQGWTTLSGTDYDLTRKGLTEFRDRINASQEREGLWRILDEYRVKVLSYQWRTEP